MPRGHEHDPFYSLGIRNMVLHCVFLRKKAIIITSKHCTTSFFPITIYCYSSKTLSKNALKGARLYEVNISECAHAPGYPP